VNAELTGRAMLPRDPFRDWRKEVAIATVGGDEAMRALSIDERTPLEFTGVPLRFEGGTYSDVFAKKNNKTLSQTLEHHRYAGLAKFILPKYASSLATPLGTFLIDLKRSGDAVYRKFLNPYGDLVYSSFSLADRAQLKIKGVYAYYVGSELKYIGRCNDSVNKRINYGYGTIHPKNCFIDGQATNCRLNALITQAQETGQIGLWICQIAADESINVMEALLCRRYTPSWNIRQL
jgi:hypothetical protein